MKRARIQKRETVFGLMIGVIGLVLAVGAQTFAQACVHADGSAAVCTPSGTWLTVTGGLIAVLSGLSMLRPGLFTFILPGIGGLLAILVPGTLVSLCASPVMRCQAVTRPFALVMGVLVMVLSAWHAVLLLAQHEREERP